VNSVKVKGDRAIVDRQSMDELGDFTEVTAFVENGKILAGVQSPSPSWLVIDDWDTAQRFAYDQEATGQDVWTDLRSSVAAKLIPAGTNAPEELGARIRKLSDEYSAVLLDRLGLTPAGRVRLRKAGVFPHPASEIVDDIIADLRILAEARLLRVTLPLFEEIFAAYRAGGWPCGWEGAYPVGRLVVFTP
jgi:hypothetical protein